MNAMQTFYPLLATSNKFKVTYHTKNIKISITLFQFGYNICSMILKMTRPQRDEKMRMI